MLVYKEKQKMTSSIRDTTTLLILAAGMGSRYGSLKQIDPLGPGGHSLIEYIIYDAIRAGFTSFVFIVRPEIQHELEAYFSKRLPSHLPIRFVIQDLSDIPIPYTAPSNRKKPWGTSHAVFSAREHIHTPFAVVNCDDYYGTDAISQIYDFLQHPHPHQYAVCGYRLDTTLSSYGPVSRGVCSVDQKGYLEEITEHTRILKQDGNIESVDKDDMVRTRFQGNEIVSMNLFGFMPDFFPLVQEHLNAFLKEHINLNTELYIPTIINAVLRSQKISMKVIPISQQWFGITYREDREQAFKNLQKMVHKGLYPLHLWR